MFLLGKLNLVTGDNTLKIMGYKCLCFDTHS